MVDAPVHVPGVELLEELGHGTSSVVYRAQRGGAFYAVKMPLRNETGIKLKILSRRFRREAVALARLRHPLLPRVMEVGVVERAPYIIMELAQGETLAQRILRGPLDEKDVVELGRQLASVLSQVHESGLVHRDVKPKNIVFDSQTGQIRLVDFGFAASIDAAFRILEPVGTLEYAAPEQVSDIRQRVDGRADLYAVGCVLYECLTQSPPFPELDPKRLLFQHGSHQIPDVREAAPKTSSTMALILKRLLARDPDRRYATAAALSYDLEHIDEIRTGALTPSPYGHATPPASPLPLFGRDKELSRLRRDWVDVESGHSRIAVLRGGAGSGKTRLAHALMDFVMARGYKVLAARCHAWDPRPFSAIREIVEGNAQDLPSQDKAKAALQLKILAGDLAPILKVLSPTIASMLTDVAPVPQSQDAQHIFVEGLAEFLRKLFREVGPAIVFVDDFQWLDPSSRRVLRRALDRSEDSKTLYLFSARGTSGEIAEVDRFLDGLAFTQINVDELAEKDIAGLIGAYLGDPVIDAELVRSVTQLSDGTPLSTLEILRMMLDDGHLLPSWGQWKFDVKTVAQMQLSESTRGVLERRIESLDDMTKSTITAAAIVGMTFEDRWLPLICRLEEGHTTAALAEARRAMLVEPARMGTHRFVHDSVREVLLRNLAVEARRELHQRAAEAMDVPAGSLDVGSRGSAPPNLQPASLSDTEKARPSSLLVGGNADADASYSLASHYARGIPERMPARVYETNVAAGRLAFHSFDNERALAFFQTAEEASRFLQLPPDPALNLLVGEAKLRIGALENSRERFAGVLAMTDDPLAQALALSRIAWIYQLQLDSTHAWNALEQAFAKLGKRCPTDSIWAAFTSWAAWMWSRVKRKAGEVSDTERQALEAVCSLYYQSARLASADEKPLRIVEAALSGAVPAERLGPSTSLARIYVTLSFVFTALGIRKAGRKYLRLAEEVARSTADPVAIAHALQIHIAVAAWDGNMRDAIETGKRCLEEYGHWRELSEYCIIAYNQHLLLEMCGRSLEAWHAMEHVIDRVEHHEGDPFLVGLLEVGARAALACIGREQEADWRLRTLRKLTVRVPENSGFHTWTYVPRLRLFTECGEFGEGFESLVKEFESKKLNPKRVHLVMTQFYVHLAHARIHAHLRAAPSDRPAILPKLASVRRDLHLAARIPVIRAHSFVVDAYYEMFAGKPAQAERMFAKAEALGREENAPWVLYAVYRGRGHLLRDRGRDEAARDQARLAAALAIEHGMAYRLRWIQEEFGLLREPAREAPQMWPPSATQSISDLLQDGSSGHLRSLLRLTKAAPEDLDPASQTRAILDDLIRSLRAQRGLLFVPHDGPLKGSLPVQGHIALLAGRNAMGEDVAEADEPTRRLVHEAVADFAATSGAEASYLLTSTPSRAILAVPLCIDEVLVGAVYLDREVGRGVFSEPDGELLVALAAQVPVALELARVLGARQRTEDELQRAQRLESMGRMARGVARDFGRLLADIQESAGVVMSANVNGARNEVQAIQSATWRAEELTKRLLAFSDGESEVGEPISVNDRIRRSATLLDQLLGSSIALTIRPASDLDLIKADPGQIDQMLVTLALRAREAMPKGGSLVVETSNAIVEGPEGGSHSSAKPGRYVRVAISDTGRALEASERKQIFDPFVSEDGAGAGLALATLYRNVTRSGGFTEVESLPLGTTFRIYWPTTTDRAASRFLAEGVPMLPHGTETILLVEHEPLTTDALGRVLKDLGYRVLVAHDGVQALKLAAQRYVEIDLVICDASLPGMSGPELGRELLKMRKSLRVLYLSDPLAGHATDETGGANAEFLHKPVQQDALAKRVREVLDRRVAS